MVLQNMLSSERERRERERRKREKREREERESEREKERERVQSKYGIPTVQKCLPGTTEFSNELVKD